MFDIFNIRKCREMRDEIERLEVAVSNERRKYEMARELYDVAKAEIYNLKLNRNNLSGNITNLHKKLDELNNALNESLARRDELSREIENLTAQNNSLKEKVNFLGDTTKRRNETAGRLLEERTELETKICVLKNENDSLRKKYRTLRGINFYTNCVITDKAGILKRFREHYVNYVIKIALMMCEVKGAFSQNELCEILDVGKDVLFKTGIKEEVNPTKKGLFLVYPSSEVKMFIKESKSLREVLFNATTRSKTKKTESAQ